MREAMTLAEEVPFVSAVCDGHLDRTCANCFRQFVPGLPKETCQTCGILNYCCDECKEEDLKFHRQECKYIKKSGFFPTTMTRLVSRIAVRIKRGDVPRAFNGRSFDDLMDHLEDYKKSSGTEEDWHNRYMEMACIYRELEHFMGPENVPPREVAYSYMGKCFTNQFPAGIYSNVICILIGFSVHNHSCKPDCFPIFDGKKAKLRTFNPELVYKRELTFAYLPEWRPRSIRRKCLKFFVCKCERCQDDELNLFESSGKSSCCPEDGVILPKEGPGPLICSNCGKESTLTYQKITWANNLIEKKYLEDDQTKFKGITANALESEIKLFRLLQDVLAPYNLYLLAFAEYLAEKTEHFGDFNANRELTAFGNEIMKEVCPRSFFYKSSWFMAAKKEAYIAVICEEKSQLGPWEQTVDIFKTAYFFSRNMYGPNHEILNLLQILFIAYVEEYTKDPDAHVSTENLHNELLSLTYSEKTVSKGVYKLLRKNAKRREKGTDDVSDPPSSPESHPTPPIARRLYGG